MMRYLLFLSSLLSLLLQFASSTTLSQYTPASALLSEDSSTLYLFLPSPQTTEFKFVSLNVSDRVAARNMSNAFRELPAPPPPKNPGLGQISMTPLLFSGKGTDKNDVMVLLTGSCDSDLGLYEYNVSDHAGVWQSRNMKSSMEVAPKGRNHAAGFSYEVSATTSAIAPGPTFMSGARLSDDELHEYEQGNVVATEIHRKAFLFGGTCPGEMGPVYTNSMLELEFPTIREVSYIQGKRKGLSESGPEVASAAVALVERGSGGNNSYDWPIPESGFSFTTVSKGDSMTTVMIGGHTERAFVDMRQVAVYLVPEGRWRFADVSLPRSFPPKLPTSSTKVGNIPEPTPGATREDLSTIVEQRDEGFTRRIDSRAGHTAVATNDGKRVIVYGGWVGDVNTPAEPRLIVLDMSGEIGRGGWRWEVPYIFGGELGPPGDGHQDGLAGHAAVMLDGDIMMITSGYKISPFEAGKAPQVSEGTYLFNVTTNTWISTYSPPKATALPMGEKGEKECKDNKTATVLGVLLGLLSAIAAVALFFWYRRRNKDSDEEDPMRGNTWEIEGRRTFGFYSKDGSNASADRIGIVEKTHMTRMLGANQSSSSLSRSLTPDGGSPSQSSPSASPPQPTRQMQVYRGAAVPARVSTILESDEESIRRHSASSAGATDGSTDLAEIYNRSLAFAEKMAQQETIYERTRESSRSGTPTSDGWTPDASTFPKPPAQAPIPPAMPGGGGRPRLVAATLSSESLNSLPKAPLRIPYTRSYPPSRARTIAPSVRAPKMRTLMKPARFFPSPPRPTIAQRSISLDAHARFPTTTAGSSTVSTAPPPSSSTFSSNPSLTPSSNILPTPTPTPSQPRGIKRWLSVTAVRNALPQIKPSSPLSLFGSTSFRSVSSSASLGREDMDEGDEEEEEEEEGGGSRSVSVPIMLDRGDEWDVEAAIGAGRVVQIMFTAPKGALRVVNYDEPLGG